MSMKIIELTKNERVVARLEKKVFKKIIFQYKEECLHEYTTIEKALATEKISVTELENFSKFLNMEFEFFLLNHSKAEKEIKNIEKHRKDKYKKTESVSRARGGIVSYRLIDRYIRLQYFISKEDPVDNKFNGFLKNFDNLEEQIKKIEEYFDFSVKNLREKKKKKDVLDFLIKKIEGKRISVCRSHMQGKSMPTFHKFKEIYRSMEGFYLYDIKTPFIFLMNEKPTETQKSHNEDEQDLVKYRDEPIGTMIYSLFYFLVCIGLGYKYDSKKKDVSILRDQTYNLEAHKVTSRFFIREIDLDEIKIEKEKKWKDYEVKNIREWSKKFVLTPSAINVILKNEGVISNKDFNYIKEKLTSEWEEKKYVRSSIERSTRINNALRKQIGDRNMKIVDKAFKKGDLTNTQYKRILGIRPKES